MGRKAEINCLSCQLYVRRGLISEMEFGSQRPSWRRLIATVERALTSEDCGALRVLPCDRDRNGRFKRYGGLAMAREALVHEHYRGQDHRAVLLLGMLPLFTETVALTAGVAALTRWAGFAHLPYGFTCDELFATARRAIAGAKAPLPLELLRPIDDILRHTSEVRHWLENRLRNSQGALSNFEKATRGEIRLHSAHLEPVASISEEHRTMLDRLWALDVPAKLYAPHLGGFGPLQTAIEAFETHWQVLEAARAALRATGVKAGEDGMRDMVRHLDQVCGALAAAISATRELDRELTASEVN